MYLSNVKPCKHNKAIVTQLKESYHKTVEKLGKYGLWSAWLDTCVTYNSIV